VRARVPHSPTFPGPQVDAIRQGTALVLECRRLKRYDAAALTAAAKLLKVVPEVWPPPEGSPPGGRAAPPQPHRRPGPNPACVSRGRGVTNPGDAHLQTRPRGPHQIYTVWNYRREALGPAFEAGGDAAQAASDGELALTQVGGAAPRGREGQEGARPVREEGATTLGRTAQALGAPGAAADGAPANPPPPCSQTLPSAS
jgi:hypothetical protein